MLAALLATQTTGTPATVGASPGIATFSSGPGQASVASSAVSLGPLWWQYLPKSPGIRKEGIAYAEPGRIRTRSASGAARGGTKQPPVARLPERKRKPRKAARARVQRAQVFVGSPLGRAFGGATAPCASVEMRATGWSGGAQAGAAMGAAAGVACAGCSPGGAHGYHNPTEEQLAAVLLLLDLEG